MGLDFSRAEATHQINDQHNQKDHSDAAATDDRTPKVEAATTKQKKDENYQE